MSEAKFKFGDRVWSDEPGYGEVIVAITDKDGAYSYFVAFPSGRVAWMKESELTFYAAPPNTVPVRIAVAVTANGEWAADGGSRYKGKDILAKGTAHECVDFEDARITFITAHVPLPEQPAEIEGTVEP